MNKFSENNYLSPILVISKNILEGQEGESFGLEKILEMIKNFPKAGFVVIDYSLGDFRKIKSEASCRVLSYGFEAEADLRVTDFNIGDNGTNFKINYDGKSIPFWIEQKISEEETNNLLAAILVLAINKVNLVEISQLFKSRNF